MMLYILRHAAAEEAASSGDDGARKLTERSKEKMRGAASGLRAMGLKFNVILTKHYVILPLIAISGYIWFFLARKMSKPGADNSKWWRQLIVLAWAQAILGVVVLVLAAILVS
jgi:hypothetical protein